jgi:hypothetical protein
LDPGKYAIVDADDYERLAKYKWHVCDNGYSSYAFRWSREREKRVWMHREVIDIPEGLVCDHIDHNSLDNRKANLRPATVSQNNCNSRRKSQTTSRYRGVSRDAMSNRYRARIKLNGRRTHLGMFDDQEQAARVYDAAAKKYHGQFAVLNFPDRPPSRVTVLAERFLAKIAEKWEKVCKSVQKLIETAKKWAEVRRSGHQGSRREGTRGAGDQGREDRGQRTGVRDAYCVWRFSEKIGENYAKVSETCEKSIEIARKWAEGRKSGHQGIRREGIRVAGDQGREDGGQRADVRDAYCVCKLFEKIGENYAKVSETCEKLIEIVRKWVEGRRSGHQGIRREGIRGAGDQEREDGGQRTGVRDAYCVCGFFEKIGKNSAKMLESWQKSIIIAQKYAKLSTVQMTRGP